MTVRGAAKPTIKRFFISSATDNRDDYSNVTGPQGVGVKVGLDDGLYEIGAGVKLDRIRFARYNNWITERFTKGISDFPLDSEKAQNMILGEGYSFAFEGALSLGPSSFFLGEESEFSLFADFKFNKVIRSGRFEIIIYKHAENKILFSLRQARQTLNNGVRDFSISYGVSLRADLDLLVGSPSSLFSLPTGFKILSANRTRSLRNETRFNAVYEIDLANEGNKELYNDALSKFDFSLFDVFTMADLSESSSILEKFRGSDLKLVLETNEKVRVSQRGFSTSALKLERTGREYTRESSYGVARFSNRTVETASGTARSSYRQRNWFTGDETNVFEITAYEEYGIESNPSPNDVVMLATRNLFDENTTKREMEAYIREFNGFRPESDKIVLSLPDEGDFGATQARMDFFITRKQIDALKNLHGPEVRWRIVESYGPIIDAAYPGMSRTFGASIASRKKNELLSSDPNTWSFGFFANLTHRRELDAMKSLAVGFANLQTALNTVDIRGAADALNEMIKDGRQSQNYAALLRHFIRLSGGTPLINVSFYNGSESGIDYKSKNPVDVAAFAREGLILSRGLNSVLTGRGYYDDFESTYSSAPDVTRQGVVSFNFVKEFKGFIRVSLKQNVDGGSGFVNLGEFIIDVVDLAPLEFKFNLYSGESEAEKRATQILSQADGDVQVYFSLSYDDVTYSADELIERSATGQTVIQSATK